MLFLLFKIPIGLYWAKIFVLKKRKLEIVVISDVHLGSKACHVDELLAYLSSVQPKRLILNGDILDIESTTNYYFPPSHLKVIRKFLSMASKGVEIYYLMGNHDETFRKYTKSSISNIKFCNKLFLNLDGKKAWFFHGDVFDMSLTKTKWIAKLGGLGYRFLKLLNRSEYWIRKKLGKPSLSLSEYLKSSPEKRKAYENQFIDTVVDLAIDNNVTYVICGHLHKPKKEVVETQRGDCVYLNSGDWVDNLTALEYSFKRWKVYRYSNDKLLPFFMDEELKAMDMNELVATITSKKSSKESTKDGENTGI